MTRKRTIALAVLGMTGSLLVWAAGSWSPSTDETGSMNPLAGLLREELPFIFTLSAEPGPHCDPLDIEWVRVLDAAGDVLEEEWRVLDGATVQLVCDDFYTLYYRCDGPSCLNLRIVLVDGATGATVSRRQAHVCLE